jgi:hypothetical protein
MAARSEERLAGSSVIRWEKSMVYLMADYLEHSMVGQWAHWSAGNLELHSVGVLALPMADYLERSMAEPWEYSTVENLELHSVEPMADYLEHSRVESWEYSTVENLEIHSVGLLALPMADHLER